jgi:EAL domain-containing protein (putative c-di-GMP-specific phosphodiesterase class I)
MAHWRRQGHHVAGVSVNLSPTQFRSPGLISKVRAALQRNHMPAHALTLEITETTAMHDPEASLEILRELVAIGVNISIDDFGTGYSSLMYLKKLPANELKIDRGFIKDLVRGGEDAAIVSAIVALGHTLNLEVIAEGVETREQQLLLTELGCNSLQGFFIGAPVDPDTLVAPAMSAAAAARTRNAIASPVEASASVSAELGAPVAGRGRHRRASRHS